MQGTNVERRHALIGVQSIRLFSQTPWPCVDAILGGLNAVDLTCN